MMWIPESGALGDRTLQPHCSCPPLAGVQGVVTLSLSKGCPAERLETVPYNLVAHLLCGALGDRALQPRRSCTPLKGEGLPCGTVGNRSLQPPLHACDVGTVSRCWDCSPNSPKNGAFGDRALQPHCSCPPLAGGQGVVTRCSLLIARRFSLLVAYLLKNGKPTSSRGRVSIYEGAMIRKAGK